MTGPHHVDLTAPCPAGHAGASWRGKWAEPGGTVYEIDCAGCGDHIEEPEPPLEQLPSLPVSLAKEPLYRLRAAAESARAAVQGLIDRRTA